MKLSRGAIVLCGGASSRMGRDKALLPFGPDEVLLQRVVRLVSETVPLEQIVCVAAAEQSLPPLGGAVHVVRDEVPDRGPLAGLATGLAVLEGRADVVFACGCDAPLIVPAFIVRLIDLIGDKQIVIPQQGEQLHPLAAVYRTGVRPVADALIDQGERSLLALIARCDTLRVIADDLRDVDPRLTSLAGCNTQAEYQSLLAQINQPD